MHNMYKILSQWITNLKEILIYNNVIWIRRNTDVETLKFV